MQQFTLKDQQLLLKCKISKPIILNLVSIRSCAVFTAVLVAENCRNITEFINTSHKGQLIILNLTKISIFFGNLPKFTLALCQFLKFPSGIGKFSKISLGRYAPSGKFLKIFRIFRCPRKFQKLPSGSGKFLGKYFYYFFTGNLSILGDFKVRIPQGISRCKFPLFHKFPREFFINSLGNLKLFHSLEN